MTTDKKTNTERKDSPSPTANKKSNASKGQFPTSGFNGASGEWARKLHLEAGGCDQTTGGPRFVL